MPLFYCFNCGFGTSYSLNKPKVCLKCNQSFCKPTIASQQTITNNSNPVKIKLPEPITKRSEPAFSISIEEDDIESKVPSINLKSFASVDKQVETKSFVFPSPQNIASGTTPKPKRGRKSK